MKNDEKEKTGDEEQEELFRKKANIFFKEKLPVHIVIKSKIFYNGLITKLSADYFMIEDRVLGELPVFYVELYSIERQEEKK